MKEMPKRVNPSPATTWSTRRNTTRAAKAAPTAAPAASPQARPTHGEPDSKEAAKPANPPSSITPSSPRLSTPARSLIISPIAAVPTDTARRTPEASTALQKATVTMSAWASRPVMS